MQEKNGWDEALSRRRQREEEMIDSIDVVKRTNERLGIHNHCPTAVRCGRLTSFEWVPRCESTAFYMREEHLFQSRAGEIHFLIWFSPLIWHKHRTNAVPPATTCHSHYPRLVTAHIYCRHSALTHTHETGDRMRKLRTRRVRRVLRSDGGLLRIHVGVEYVCSGAKFKCERWNYTMN